MFDSKERRQHLAAAAGGAGVQSDLPRLLSFVRRSRRRRTRRKRTRKRTRRALREGPEIPDEGKGGGEEHLRRRRRRREGAPRRARP